VALEWRNDLEAVDHVLGHAQRDRNHLALAGEPGFQGFRNHRFCVLLLWPCEPTRCEWRRPGATGVRRRAGAHACRIRSRHRVLRYEGCSVKEALNESPQSVIPAKAEIHGRKSL